MIDTRNSYKIAKDTNYEQTWECFYRPWYSPFWKKFSWKSGEPAARKECVEHANGVATIHLGKLP